MIVIVKKKGDPKDLLFKKFTRMFIDEDVVFDVRNKLFFKPPSLLKKEKAQQKQKNRLRRQKM